MGRVRSAESKDPDAADFFHKQRLKHGLYTTPPGSNDDWYWLYATVKAGENGAFDPTDACPYPCVLIPSAIFCKCDGVGCTTYDSTAVHPTMMS